MTGTIAGWDAMPAPAADHNRLAVIGASSNPALTDRANTIDQGTRSVDVDIGGNIYSFDVASNVCVRNSNPLALVNDCNWVLTTHAGAQAHFAILVDQDTKGTPDDDADDTITATGWAIKTGLSFGDGTTTGGEIAAADRRRRHAVRSRRRSRADRPASTTWSASRCWIWAPKGASPSSCRR